MLTFPPKQILNAGRLVVLRVPRASDPNQAIEDVEAQEVDSTIFRQMVFTDLSKHEMTSYQKLVENYCYTARKRFRSATHIAA